MPRAFELTARVAAIVLMLLLAGGGCYGAREPRSPLPLDALPKGGELLAAPIAVQGCEPMQIVEWRSSAAFSAETSATAQALAVIAEACRVGLARFPDFARARGLKLAATAPSTLPSLSLLPGNVLLDGTSPRSLNDVPGRFAAVATGCCYWGLYVDRLNHLFVRNDPLVRGADGGLVKNPRFVRTFEHELAHVLNVRLGVLASNGLDRVKDEELAEDFVAFLGFDFPTESSSDDLAIRVGQVTGPTMHARLD